MSKINKKKYTQIFSFFLILSIFSISHKALAASINFSQVSNKYNIGDTIKIKVLISSQESINAVSGKINFPPDILSLTAILKDSSIIDLWAQEPSYSNIHGLVNFEGVVLNGYTGDAGDIITLIFKAKTVGQVDLKFSDISILANDGNGTNIFSSDLSDSYFDIKKEESIKKTESIFNCLQKNYFEEKFEGNSNSSGSVLACMAFNANEKIKEIEISNHLIKNSLLVAIIIIFIIIIAFVCIYFFYLIFRLKKYFKFKLKKIEKIVSNDFKNLEQGIDSKILENDMIKENEGVSIINEVTKTEDNIINEIEEVKKEV